MTLELVAIATSGILAFVATGVVFIARMHGAVSRDIKIISGKSGDKLRISKSSDGVIRSIEIINPSTDVQNMLDV